MWAGVDLNHSRRQPAPPVEACGSVPPNKHARHPARCSARGLLNPWAWGHDTSLGHERTVTVAAPCGAPCVRSSCKSAPYLTLNEGECVASTHLQTPQLILSSQLRLTRFTWESNPQLPWPLEARQLNHIGGAFWREAPNPGGW